MTNLQLLNNFKSESARINLFIGRRFMFLTNEQLNFRTIPGKWSICEIFEHLIVSHRLYYDKLSESILSNKLKKSEEDKPVINTFIGKKIIESVKPDSNKRVKTFKLFQPQALEINDEVLEKFILLQNKFFKLCENLTDVNLSKIKLSSPVSKLFRLNAADVLMIIMYHNIRHIKQADKMVDLCFFPKEPNRNGFKYTKT